MSEDGADIPISKAERSPKEASDNLSERRQAVKGLTEDLLKRINYGSVLAFEVEGKDLSRTVDDLFYLRRSQMAIAFGTLDTEDEYALEHRESTLREYGEDWEDRGYLDKLDEDGESPPLVYGEAVLEEQRRLLAQLDWDGVVLQRLGELYKTYRQEVTIIQGISRWQGDFTAALRLDNRRPDFQEALDKFGMDPRLLEAASRLIHFKESSFARAGRFPQTEEERTAHIERCRKVPREPINIEGFREGVEASIAERVGQELTQEIPPYFLQGLMKVEMKDKSAIPVQLKGQDLDHYASLLTRWHLGYIKEANLEVYREPVNKLSVNLTEAQTTGIVLMGLNHEIGHNIHYRLTFEEMEGWEGVIAAEKVGVTKYVQEAYVQDADLAKREDFAESFGLFVNNPGLLKIVAPTRFAYFAALLDRYLPDDQRKRFSDRLNYRALTMIMYAGEKGMKPEDVVRDSGAKPLD